MALTAMAYHEMYSTQHAVRAYLCFACLNWCPCWGASHLAVSLPSGVVFVPKGVGCCWPSTFRHSVSSSRTLSYTC